MDASVSQNSSSSSQSAGKVFGLYVVWVLSLAAALLCLGLILPELVLLHQFHNVRERLQEIGTPAEQELFLNLLLDYSGSLSNWRAVTGFIAGIGGVAVWVMGQKPWFFYAGILGASAFALNLLMMIWI